MNAFKVFATMSLTDAISKPLAFIRGGVGKTEASINSLSAKLGKLATSLGKVALPAAAFLGALTGMAMATVGTEKAMAELASLGVTEMAQVEKAARTASNSVAGVTADSFITAAYDIKSGIATLSDEGVAAYTGLAAKTAQATKAGVDQMTSLFATATGIWRNQYSQMNDFEFGEMFAAGLASSVKSFKTSGEGMQAAIQSLGASGSLAKVPMEEQLSILGELQVAMEAPVAGTAYKAFFRDATKGFKSLGIQALDSAGQLRPMPDLLAELEQKFGDIDQVGLDKITQGFGEGGVVLKQLYGKSEQLRTSIQGVNADMAQGAGYVDKMRAAMNTGLGPSMELLKQRFWNLIEIVGGWFAPTLALLAENLGYLVIGLQAVAASPVAGFILQFIAGLSAALVGVTGFIGILAVVKPALLAVMVTLKAVFWPVTLIAGAVALLAAAWKYNFLGIADTVRNFFGKVSLVFEGITSLFSSLSGSKGQMSEELAQKIEAAGLMGLVTTIGKIIFRVMSFFKGLGEGVMDGLDALWQSMKPCVDSVREALSPLIDMVGDLIGSFAGAAEGTKVSVWADLGKTIGTVVMIPFRSVAAVVEVVMRVFAGVMKVVAPVGSFLAAKLAPVVGRLWGALKNLAGAVGGLIGKFFDWAGSLMGASDNSGISVWEQLGNIMGGSLSIALSIVTGALDLVISALTWVVGGVTKAINAFSDFTSWLLKVWSQSSSFGDFLKTAFTEAWNYLSNIDWSACGQAIIDTLVDGISSVGGRIYDTVSGVFAKVRELLPFSDAHTGPFSGLTASGMAIINTLIEGIKAKAGAMVDTVSGVFGKVWDFFAHSDAKRGPFSNLTKSGMAIPQTLATGLEAASPALIGAAANMVGRVDLAPPPVDWSGLSGYGHTLAAPYFESPVLTPPSWRAGESLPAPRVGRLSPEEAGGVAPWAGKAGTNKTVHVHIGKIELPNVSDSDGFIAALEAIAAERTS